MKKFKSFLLLSILLIASFSCSKNNIVKDGGKEPSDGTQKFHTLFIDGNKTIIKEENGVYYFSEDETLSEHQFNFLKSLQNKSDTKARSAYTSEFVKYWPNNVIYYKNSSNKTNILNALNHIMNQTGVLFLERTNQANYIEFVNSDGNSSDIGMQGGRQKINIFNDITGVIVHEVLHAMGFFHEMARPDRDNFVNIFYANIKDDKDHNFNIRPDAVAGGQFDFGSIMMYDSHAFSKNGQPTILKKNNDLISEYQIARLSTQDAGYVRLKYPIKIVGPDYFCPSGTYSVDGLKSGAVVTWSVADDNYATYSGNGGVFYKKPDSWGGPAVIVATITRNGESFKIWKEVNVGLYPSGITYYNSSAIASKSVMFKYGDAITWNPGVNYYEVRSLDGTRISSMPAGFNPSQNNSLFVSGGNGFRLADPYSFTSSIYVEVRYYTSTCGWTNWHQMTVVF